MTESPTTPPRLGLLSRNFINLPINGISITDSAYDAIDDGLDGYFTATWADGQPELALATYSGSVTVSNTGPNGVAVLSINNVSGNGTSPNMSWIGKPIAITGAGESEGTFVSKVVDVAYRINLAPQVVLAAPAAMSLTGSIQQVTCPCFSATDVNKTIWAYPLGYQAAGNGNPLIRPLVTTIARYISPYQIILAANALASAQTDKAGIRIVWGTDNTQAIINAGLASIAAGRKILFFPGLTKPESTGVFCAFNFEDNTGPLVGWSADAMLVSSALHWVGSEARCFIVPSTGSPTEESRFFQDTTIRKEVIPWNAGPPLLPHREAFGAQSFPRCASQSTVVVVFAGDSMEASTPSGQYAISPIQALKVEIVRQNPGKTIRFVNRSIGGGSWAGLNSIPTVFPDWYTDRGAPWLSYVRSVPVPGLGTVTPDLVVLGIGGNNDVGYIRENDILSVINKVRSWPAANGFTPDVMMVTGRQSGLQQNNQNQGGPGGYDVLQCLRDYTSTLIRSVARTQKIALLDYNTRAAFVRDGWSPEAMVLRSVPALSAGIAGPRSPYQLPYQCRDFFLTLRLGGTSGTDFWSRAGTLQIQLSPKGDNRLVIGVDASNNLSIAAIGWGLTIATPLAISSGSTSLVTSGQSTIVTGGGGIFAPPTYSIFSTAHGFSPGMVNQAFLAPGINYSSADYRTFILSYGGEASVFGCDTSLEKARLDTVYSGGHMFVAGDATAQVDCIVAGAGATNHLLTGADSLVTKVIGYTSRNAATLVDSAANPVNGSANMFLGRISVAPTYDVAVAAGSDAGANPLLTIKKTGTQVTVGYVLGSVVGTDLRQTLQDHEVTIWSGDVECYGAPFAPRIWASISDVTITPLSVAVGERSLRMPALTSLEMWGMADAGYDWPYGGDGAGHLSTQQFEFVDREVCAAQDLTFG